MADFVFFSEASFDPGVQQPQGFACNLLVQGPIGSWAKRSATLDLSRFFNQLAQSCGRDVFSELAEDGAAFGCASAAPVDQRLWC